MKVPEKHESLTTVYCTLTDLEGLMRLLTNVYCTLTDREGLMQLSTILYCKLTDQEGVNATVRRWQRKEEGSK